MRQLSCLSALLLSCAIQAQVEMPRVDMPTVEMPRVEMPSVEMPGTSHTPDRGRVQQWNGFPNGTWRAEGLNGRIRLYDASGMPGIILRRSITGRWQPALPGEQGTWKMDEGTGTLRQDP